MPVLEEIANPVELDTQDEPVLRKKPRSLPVALGVNSIGSRIDLYLIDGIGKYTGCFIVPSDYELSDERIIHLDNDIRKVELLLKGKPHKNKSLEKLRMELFDIILPPMPIDSKDYNSNKPRIMRYLFREDNTLLLMQLIRGMKT